MEPLLEVVCPGSSQAFILSPKLSGICLVSILDIYREKQQTNKQAEMNKTFSQPSSASSAHLSLALKPNRSRKVKLEKDRKNWLSHISEKHHNKAHERSANQLDKHDITKMIILELFCCQVSAARAEGSQVPVPVVEPVFARWRSLSSSLSLFLSFSLSLSMIFQHLKSREGLRNYKEEMPAATQV